MDPTQRIRALDRVRRGTATAIHAVRKAITPPLRGQPAHTTLISSATYSPWHTDPVFQAVFTAVGDHTLLDEMRLHELWQLADQVGHLDGDGIEVGCWRGGAGAMVAARLAERRPGTAMVLCDTFSGVVKAGDRDRVYQGGEHGDATEDDVHLVAERLGVTDLEILRGVFPDDTGDAVADRTFKFAHIDLDVYEGVRDSFYWLLPRLVPGAIVVFDDYGSATTDGVRSFIDELHGNPAVAVVRNLNGQATAVHVGASGR